MTDAHTPDPLAGWGGTICLLTDEQARRLADVPGIYWRYGEPGWDKRKRLREAERIRAAREKLDAEEAALKDPTP